MVNILKGSRMESDAQQVCSTVGGPHVIANILTFLTYKNGSVT